MKKITSLLLVVCFLLALCAGCASNTATTTTETTTEETTTPAVEETAEPAEEEPAEEEPTAAEETPADAIASYFDYYEGYQVEILEAADGTVTYDGLTKEQLEDSLPKEYIAQKLAAGMEVSVAFLVPSLKSATLAAMSEGFRARAEALGMTYYEGEMMMDIAQQLTMIENYMTLGVSLVITFCIDSDSMYDTAQRAMDGGMFLYIWNGVPNFPVSIAVCTEQYDVGVVTANMAIDWVDKNFPDAGQGEIKAAVIHNALNADFIAQYTGLSETLAADGRITLVYDVTGENHTIDEGYTFAQDAFTVDDCQIIFTKVSAQAVGANNYIVGNGLGSDKVAVFASDNEETGRELIDQSDDPTVSVFRGLVGTGTDDASEGLWDYAEKIMFGLMEEGQVLGEGIYAYNNIGFDYDERG